jgi:hypothetical protein|tara:strand:+ start:75 stop:656 length:582 start_codon:yes stop_codon:yes gene_type:complete
MKINKLINPSPKLVANAIIIDDSNWKWDFIEKDSINKTRNFAVYFYVAKQSQEILKIGSTDGVSGLEGRVRATANGNKGTAGGHDFKMQPTILELLNLGFEIELYAIVTKPEYREYVFQGEIVRDELVDSSPQESRYIKFYKSQHEGQEPPFNFNNKGKSPKKMGLTKAQFVKQDLQERLNKAKKLCQEVLQS